MKKIKNLTLASKTLSSLLKNKIKAAFRNFKESNFKVSLQFISPQK